MKKYFFLLFVIGLLFSCDSEYSDICGNFDTSVKDSAFVVTRSTSVEMPNYLFLDIYGDKYKTFIIQDVRNDVVGDSDPFPYIDDGVPTNCADYSLIDLSDGLRHFYFDDSGLFPTIYRFNPYIGPTIDKIQLGEKVAIWASEEEYTNEDLKAHDGDVEYFTKVGESFTCCYITTLRPHMVIVFDSVRWFD